MTTPNLIAIVATLAAILTVHVWARWYSKNHYEYFACSACKGGSKKWEPLLLKWACFRRKKRAFTACPACGGTGKYTR